MIIIQSLYYWEHDRISESNIALPFCCKWVILSEVMFYVKLWTVDEVVKTSRVGISGRSTVSPGHPVWGDFRAADRWGSVTCLLPVNMRVVTARADHKGEREWPWWPSTGWRDGADWNSHVLWHGGFSAEGTAWHVSLSFTDQGKSSSNFTFTNPPFILQISVHLTQDALENPGPPLPTAVSPVNAPFRQNPLAVPMEEAAIG